jgi:hypothetical protein
MTSSPSPVPPAEKLSLWAQMALLRQNAYDLLFGYDYFIAHRSKDGKDYARALYALLTENGNELDCFLDAKYFTAGGLVKLMQTRALRSTTRLVVIVTPGAGFLPTQGSQGIQATPPGRSHRPCHTKRPQASS